MIFVYFVLFWNSVADYSEIIQETCMEYPLCDFLISVRLDNKPGRDGQFLILIVWNLINLLLWNYEVQWIIGMIYGRFSTKCLYFMPIVQLMWPPYAVLVCDCPKKNIFSKIICSFYYQKKCRLNMKYVDALPLVVPYSYSNIRRNSFITHVISDQIMLPLNEAHWNEL